MKKSLFTPFLSVCKPVVVGFVLVAALLVGTTPVATAQAYYGNYSTYGTMMPYQTCIALTVFQGPGSTDSVTSGQVTMLQQFLNRTGYLSGVSGTYDNGTLGAVINFQRAYGVEITGTVGPVTRAAINQQSCGAGVVAPGYPVTAQPAYSYPVTNYSNGSNCYWTGGTYNSTYVCTTAPAMPVAPMYPAPVVCNSWNGNNYNQNQNYNQNNSNNGYYGNNANYCNPYNSVVLNSLASSNVYNGTSITIKGSGFTASGNTVYFGNTVIANTYSANGTSLTFTVPSGYYSGTYGISVKNASGVSSNTLSYIMSNTNYWNNNNFYNTSLSVSNVSGPSGVQTGMMNTWTVTTSGSNNNNNVTVHANWGDNYSTSGNDTQQSYSNGSQAYSFSHVYQTSGTYIIRMTVTDSSGNTAYSTYSVTVTGNGYNNYYPYRGY